LDGATSVAKIYAIADRVLDKIDAPGNGLVRLRADNIYLTPNSFFAPTTTAASIQRGIDAAASGETVNVAAGIYTGDVNVNKSLTLNGAEAGVNPNDAAWNDARSNAANESVIHGAVNLSLRNDIVVDGFTIERTPANEGHILIGSGLPSGTG